MRQSLNLKMNNVNRIVNVFVHHFYLLQRFSSQRNLNDKSLVRLLSQICSDICQIFSSIKSSQSLEVTTNIKPWIITTRAQQKIVIHNQTEADHGLRAKITVLGRIFPFLLKAVHKLSQTDKKEQFKAQIIYNFVGLFRDLLQHICALSMPHKENHELPMNSQKSKKNTRVKPKVISGSKSLQTPDKSITSLCHFLNTFVTALDTNNATHKEILQGYLFFLLRHVGTTLETFVFGADNTTTIPAPPLISETAASPPHIHEEKDEEEERQIAEAQAPYLIPLLSHAIHTATRHPQPPPAPNQNHTPPPTNPPPIPPRSTTTTFQSTLLTALFGPDFPDAIPLPIDPNIHPDGIHPDGIHPDNIHPGIEIGSEPDGGVAEWFKAEVWRIVGWDILAGRIAWE